MSSDDYRPPLHLDPSDSGHSTVSPTQDNDGGRPVDVDVVQEQGVVAACELQRWKNKYCKLEAKYKQLLNDSGKNVDEEMRSLDDEEHSFELVEGNVAEVGDSHQPASAFNVRPSLYAERQRSKELSVISGEQSFTVVAKDGGFMSCKGSLKRVSEYTEGKAELHRLQAENKHLQQTVEELETQLSLAEARVEDSQSGQFTRSGMETAGAGSTEETLLRNEVSTLQDELSSVKRELTTAREDADRALQEGRDMKAALDRTVAEKLQLEGEVAEQKKIAKDWKMQLDETTCRLIQKQDEIEALQPK